MLTELVHENQLRVLFEEEYPDIGKQSMVERYREKKPFSSHIPVRYLPNVAFSIFFNLGERLTVQNDDASLSYTDHILLPLSRTWVLTGHYFEIRFGFSPLPFLTESSDRSFLKTPIAIRDLLCPEYVCQIENAASLSERSEISENYFSCIYEKAKARMVKYRAVQEMMTCFIASREEIFKIEDYLRNTYISSKSLQRYFARNFGVSPKTVYCILRMRKALQSYFDENSNFRVHDFDYYDYSHFYKEIKKISGFNLPELKNGGGGMENYAYISTKTNK